MSIINKNITILCGDLRSIYLANNFAENNLVTVTGMKSNLLSKNINQENDFKKSIYKADIIVGPIPLTHDDIYLNLNDYEITLEEVVDSIDKNTIFVGCKISDSLCRKLKNRDIEYYDILLLEEFTIANAIPTAEGSIQIAMENTDFMLTNSECLVLGFGRCGKILAQKLKGLGANVTVMARKSIDIEYIRALGYIPLDLKYLKEYICKYEVIFNTVPSMILDAEMLEKAYKANLIVDIASKPGGTDFDKAKELGIKATLSLGLPGKCAPKTASDIIRSSMEIII